MQQKWDENFQPQNSDCGNAFHCARIEQKLKIYELNKEIATFRKLLLFIKDETGFQRGNQILREKGKGRCSGLRRVRTEDFFN
jgi:hypothetical protein